MLNSYLDLSFEFIKKGDKSRYANGNDIPLVILSPTALFSTFKLTTSSAKQSEDISYSHIVFLKYILITSSKDSNDLSIGLDRNRGTRKNELALEKKMKGKNHLRILLKDVFGFEEHQEKATYDLGC